MFGFIGSIAKAAVGVLIEAPIAVVADVITLGGTLSDKNQPYTATAVEKVVKNIQNSTK